VSARIDNPARAVTEPHVVLTGGETAPERSEGDEVLFLRAQPLIRQTAKLFDTFPRGGRQEY